MDGLTVCEQHHAEVPLLLWNVHPPPNAAIRLDGLGQGLKKACAYLPPAQRPQRVALLSKKPRMPGFWLGLPNWLSWHMMLWIQPSKYSLTSITKLGIMSGGRK